MTEATFVPLARVAADLDAHPATIRRRLRLGGRSLFSDPANRRKRLVAAVDVAWLREPLPVIRPAHGKEAAAA